MRPALAALRALAALQLLGAASALAVVGEGVDQPQAEVQLSSLEEKEKLEAEDWKRLVGGKGASEDEDWGELEAEDWAKMMAKRRAAEQRAEPAGNAAATTTQPASKGPGFLTWMRTKLRRVSQPAVPEEGAKDARPQVPEPMTHSSVTPPEPMTHSSMPPAMGGETAPLPRGEESMEDLEAREAARQALVNNFLDNLEHPDDSVLEKIDQAFPTTSSMEEPMPTIDVVETTTAKPFRVESTTEAGPTRPPPVFCPNPDQVREQESRMNGTKQGGREVGYETSKEGCSPEERIWTAKFLEKTFTESYRSKIADVFSLEESGTYLSIGDWRAGPLLGNWLHHAGNAVDVEGGIHLVNVALDKGGMIGCRNFQRAMASDSSVRLTCVALEGWLPDTYFVGSTHMGSCDYNMILWTKPHILKAAVEASDHAVLMIDTDVILYKDLLRLSKQKFARNADKKMITGREKNNQYNTGTVYATRQDSMPWLNAWVQANDMCLNGQMGDQSAMQHAVHYTQGMALAMETFQRGEVGECAIKGKYATHYNCVGNKAKAMKENEEWAEGVSTKPEDIAGPNPVIALHAVHAA